MTTSKTKLTKKNEKGIALIFTLIMLSLMMILAMSFALDSMFSQKAAYNSANSSSSGFMGQAQLNQILLLMKAGEANFDGSRLYSKDISYDPASPSTSIEDTDMLIDRLPVADVLESTDSVFDLDGNGTYDDPKVNWNYIKADGKIIGRTAFVVIPNDKIPLDSLVDDRAVSATLSSSCPYPKHDEQYDTETRIGKYVSEINVRAAIPAVTSNISTIGGTLNWEGTTSASTVGFDNGKYTGIWTSFSSLFSTINTAVGSDLSSSDETEFKDKLTLTIADDKEAFWMDLDDDKKINADDPTSTDYEFFKRFDLTRSDWNWTKTSEDYGFLKYVMLLTSGTTPTTAMETWADEDSFDDSSSADYSTKFSKGLPWLACFGYKDDGTLYDVADLNSTFPTIFAHRCQIAANLKDYCDDDGGSVIRPTSDIDTETWYNDSVGISTDAPSFTGNEKTPYINKIGVRVRVEREHYTNPFDSTDKTTYITLSIKPIVGLINIYGDSYSSDLKAIIYGSVTIKMSKDNGSSWVSEDISFDSAKRILTFDATDDWSSTSPAVAGHSKFMIGSATDGSGFSFAGFADYTWIKVTDVTIKKVVLYNAGDTKEAYDYVKTLQSTLDFTVFPDNTASEGKKVAWFGWAVADPRQNLNAGDWVELTSAEAKDEAGDITTTDDNPSLTFSVAVGDPPYWSGPNSQNSDTTNYGGGTNTDAPNVGGSDADPETAVDPANSATSTAHIRNAPMESPWELGFIHRGVKWQTLNLKKYVATKSIQAVDIGGNKYILGGGAYDSGDANILDQVKMTAKAKSPQKINISSQKDAVLYALFSKIKLGCDINSTMTVKSLAGLETTLTGTEIDVDSPATTVYTIMRDAIKTKYASPDTTSYTNLTRASIAGRLSDSVILLSEASGSLGPDSAITDAGKEELIGKMVNLIKVGGTSGDFSIIILSQTIKDIGVDSPDDIEVTKTSADGLATQPVSCQLGRFDVVGSDGSSTLDSDWNKNVYGDEITGEQKILVKGNFSSDGAVTIESFQYIE